MIIIDVAAAPSIDRALKQYKRKLKEIGTLKELRKRKQFTKPSVEKRTLKLKASYINEKYGNS